MRWCGTFASGISAPRSECCQPGTRGGVLFGRGSLFYLLRNRFYVGEVKYRDEILPGDSRPSWTVHCSMRSNRSSRINGRTQSTIRNASNHLLTGLLFDDANHRMVPTHATKTGIRYRYYSSLPLLHGESKSASVGSVTRIPAADIQVILKSLNEYLVTRKERPSSSLVKGGDRKVVLEQVARIDVYQNHLTVRLKPKRGTTAGSESHH